MYDIVHASTLALTHEPVPRDQVVAGTPTIGVAPLHDIDGRETGVWEMSVGAMTDVEVDEVFVVLFGEATVEFVDEGQTVTLGAGSVGRLTAGQKTVWTVTATLRKVYFA